MTTPKPTKDNTVDIEQTSDEVIEALQGLLRALALQALIRQDGREATLLHLDRLDSGSAALEFTMRLCGPRVELQGLLRSHGAATPILYAAGPLDHGTAH